MKLPGIGVTNVQEFSSNNIYFDAKIVYHDSERLILRSNVIKCPNKEDFINKICLRERIVSKLGMTSLVDDKLARSQTIELKLRCDPS